jgi:hypothetical protein
MQYEVELYIPIVDERGQQLGERLEVVHFAAPEGCPTVVAAQAQILSREYGASAFSFGRIIARDADNLPDYGNQKKGRDAR